MKSVSAKNLILLFLLALLVRIVYVFFFVEQEYLLHEDQSYYIYLSKQISIGGLSAIDSERVLGYPFFLSIIDYLLGDNMWHIIGLQLVIDSFSCVIIALLVQLFFSKGFWIAGVISSFNLSMVILSAMVLTDTIFLFLFVLSLFFLFKYMRKNVISLLLLSVLLLSIATIVRPVSYYLLPLILVGLVIWRLWLKDSAVKVGIMIIFYILTVVTVLGWSHYKNYDQYQSMGLVSQTGTHMLGWVVPAVYQYSGQGSYQEGQILAKNRLNLALQNDQAREAQSNPFKDSVNQSIIAKEILLELGFFKIAKAWVVGSVINLLAPSLAYAPAVRSIEHPSFYETMGDGIIEKLKNYILNIDGLFYLSLLMFGTIASILFVYTSLFGMVSIIVELKNNKNYDIFPIEVAVLLLMILYFLLITGPIIGVKYMLPIEPILTLFATHSIIRWKWW